LEKKLGGVKNGRMNEEEQNWKKQIVPRNKERSGKDKKNYFFSKGRFLVISV